jgi:hypothetical protein
MSIALEIYRVMAACTSTLMLLSPIPTIWNVWKTKSTGVASIVPLVSLLMNSHNAYVALGNRIHGLCLRS